MTQQRVLGVQARGTGTEAEQSEIKGSTTIVELLRMFPGGEAGRLMATLSLPCAHCGGAFHEPLTLAAKRHHRDPRAMIEAFQALGDGGPTRTRSRQRPNARRPAEPARPSPLSVHQSVSVAAEEVLGREAELGVVAAFLDGVSSGPGALVIQGEPGIGKTTLWADLVRRAEAHGTRVLSCRPVEPEARLAFSGLADALETLPDGAFDELPIPQRRALDAALLRSDPGEQPPDPRAVAIAFRSILVALAGSSPVLVAVDDAQWLDGSSARAIGFALRRIVAEPVRIVVSTRTGTKLPSAIGPALSGAEHIDLPPLSLAAIHELLKTRLDRSLPRPQLLRVHEAARGNPFHALEIGREMLRDGASPDSTLPVPDDLRRLLRRRLSRLSPATRETLLVTAAAGQPTRALLTQVLDRDPSPALEEAELAEVVEVDAGRIRFSHPLYAAAIYAGAARERRRLLHERLAEAVEDLEERARHLALATDLPTEEVATALDRAAEQARSRGATDAAAELFGHAAKLTPPALAERKHLRDLARAECLFESGDTTEARRLLEDVTGRLPPGSPRPAALLLLATILWFDAQPGAESVAYRALEEAGNDRRLAALVHARLAWMTSDVDRSSGHARAALDLLDEREDRSLYAFALLNWAQAEFLSGRGSHEAEIERGRILQGTDVRWEYSTIPAVHAKEMDRLDDARAQFEAYIQRANDQGDEGSLAQHLVHMAEISSWLGEWDRAEDQARGEPRSGRADRSTHARTRGVGRERHDRCTPWPSARSARTPEAGTRGGRRP